MSLLPIRYALRNLARRPARTVLTFGGIAIITFLIILMAGFAQGLDRSVAASARDDVAIVLSAAEKGDLIRSFVPESSAQEVAIAAPGVLEVGGVRAASIELHAATRMGDRVGLLRGVTPKAYLVHTAVTVVDGVEPRGAFELMAGRLAAARMGLADADLAVGKTIRLEDREWKV